MSAGPAAAFLAWWAALPPLAAARAALDRAVEGDLVAMRAAVAPLLADTGWVEATVRRLVAAARADPLFEPPFPAQRAGARQGLQLLRHPRAAVSLLVLPPSEAPAAGRTILLDGQPAALRILHGGGSAARYRAAGGRLERRAEFVLAAGDRFDTAADEAWALTAAVEPTVLLQATLRVGAPPLRLFAVDDGGLRGTYSGDRAALRLRMIATMLHRLGRRDAAPALARAAREGPADARWHLARASTALDRTAALPLLADMVAADPDAEVRAAARATLALLAA